MLSLQSVAYTHPNRDILFSDIDLVVSRHEKLALIGNNGVGKSTMLRLMAGELQPSAGVVQADPKPWYVPQLAGQLNSHTVAQALRIDRKLDALHRIIAGDVSAENLRLLDDDWALEERCHEAFSLWGIGGITPSQQMESLSGGQKTKVLLAGIMIHDAATVLLDEPSNHLDTSGRELLYQYIMSTKNTLVVVSHDRTLLDLLDKVAELSRRGITIHGGNYDFYLEQKGTASEALSQDIRSQEKALRKARETEREAMQRQQKLDARGKKRQEKAGLPTISMNTFRNNAEKSTARMKDVHTEKIGSIEQQLGQLRKELPDKDRMRLDFDDSTLHTGKVLVALNDVNFAYGSRLLWQQPLNLSILSGQRLAIKGANGSGKTTLIRMILGELSPSMGAISRADLNAIYIDQDYSLINNHSGGGHGPGDDQSPSPLTVVEQAQSFNTGGLQEHEIRNRLSRFLFGPGHWDKPCAALSGGEKMRLCLCCLTIAAKSPDMIILDEPTNNLDIQNIEILTAAINEYKGTLLVVSHDERFLKEVGIHLDHFL